MIRKKKNAFQLQVTSIKAFLTGMKLFVTTHTHTDCIKYFSLPPPLCLLNNAYVKIPKKSYSLVQCPQILSFKNLVLLYCTVYSNLFQRGWGIKTLPKGYKVTLAGSFLYPMYIFIYYKIVEIPKRVFKQNFTFYRLHDL